MTSPRSSCDGSQLTLPARAVGALVSSPAPGDTSRQVLGDISSRAALRHASPAAVSDGSVCTWCGRRIPASARVDATSCGKKCRQARWRLRRRRTTEEREGEPMRFAYADPPYPGFAWKLYRSPEVDHVQLIRDLVAGGFDGWALSTAGKSLRDLLPLCPPDVEVCPWVKPRGINARGGRGRQNAWEPVIVWGGRVTRGGVRDWLRAMPARGGGELQGRKPLAFCAWLFSLLGMQPGDELTDLFPGTRVVGQSWRALSPLNVLSPVHHADPSPLQRTDAFLPELAPAALPHCRSCLDDDDALVQLRVVDGYARCLRCEGCFGPDGNAVSEAELPDGLRPRRRKGGGR